MDKELESLALHKIFGLTCIKGDESFSLVIKSKKYGETLISREDKHILWNCDNNDVLGRDVAKAAKEVVVDRIVDADNKLSEILGILKEFGQTMTEHIYTEVCDNELWMAIHISPRCGIRVFCSETHTTVVHKGNVIKRYAV